MAVSFMESSQSVWIPTQIISTSSQYVAASSGKGPKHRLKVEISLTIRGVGARLNDV